MTFEEYSALRKSKFGRKRGSIYNYSVKDVYDSLKKSGDISVNYRTFRSILYHVGTGVWDKLYAGRIIAIPYLFNMEIVPTNFKWTKRVNWTRTHALWAEDEQAFNDKLLVRQEPSRFFVRIKHSTIARVKKRWYYPHLMDIILSRKRQREIDDKYEFA